MADVVNVPLTHENAADVEEVEDRHGAKWRASAVANTWARGTGAASLPLPPWMGSMSPSRRSVFSLTYVCSPAPKDGDA